MSTEFGSRRVIMLGGGGHARVLQETLAQSGVSLFGYLAPDPSTALVGVTYLGADSTLAELPADEILLVNGVGSVGDLTLRSRVFIDAVRRGFAFASVVDPRATVRPSARVGHGAALLELH